VYGTVLHNGPQRVMLIADPMYSSGVMNEAGRWALDLDTGQWVDLFDGRPWFITETALHSKGATAMPGDSVSWTVNWK
jgi:hypothetical protein